MSTPCQRCSECADCPHHWIPNPDFGSDDAPTRELMDAEYVCKHCPALGQACDACGGDGTIGNDFDDDAEQCLGCNGLGVIPFDRKPYRETEK